MTDRERLEKAKEMAKNYQVEYDSGHPMFLDEDDIELLNWLIQQAEHVVGLERKLSINTNNMRQLQKENERYKQALEKIVNQAGINKEIDLELWKMAREALEGKTE